jgi:hypothetical protein
VLVNKPRITRERYTPFGICLDTSMQVLANAQICSLVSWVIVLARRSRRARHDR